MTKQKQPKIRFKGFNGDWKESRLRDLGEINTGSTPSTSDERNYSKDGLLWVTPTDITSPLITNTNKKLSIQGQRIARIVPKNTILVTCIASIGKNAILIEQGSFNQQINSLTPYSDLDSYFLFSQSFFWSKKMSMLASKGTMQIVNKTQFSNIETSIPFIDEQTKIGNFFQQLDNAIALHEQKHTQTFNLKKAMLEKMFPKAGCKQPEIRFKGFSGDWEEKQLKHIATKVTEKNTEGLYSETLTNSAKFGVITQRDFFDKDISNAENISGYYIVENNDFVYNPRVSTFAPVGPINRNKLERTGVISPLYFVFRTREIDHQFLETYFETSRWHTFMYLNGDTGARADRFSIKDHVFIEMPFSCPISEEQKKIGNYFKQLNDTLALQVQQLKKLKNIKQACLEKMFV